MSAVEAEPTSRGQQAASSTSFAPLGLRGLSHSLPTACAVGCILPRRGYLPVTECLSSVSGQGPSRLLRQRFVGFGAAVAEELPGLSNFSNHFEVEIGYQDFVFVAAGLGDDLAAGIAEIALAVKLADVPRL